MGSMNLDLPVVGQTPGTTWATMLNTALSPNIEEHDHSTGKGVLIKTTTTPGINVNGNMNFQDIDPLSPGFNDYNRPINLKSVQFIPGTAAGTYPVTDNLNVYCDNQDLFFRDGSGAEIQLTGSGAIVGPNQYGFQNDYDTFAANMGYASYNAGFKTFSFGSDSGSLQDTILSCKGIVNSSVIAWNWGGDDILGIGAEATDGSVRIGYMDNISTPDPANYAYPALWATEVVTDAATAQNGLRIQGNLMALPTLAGDGPEHLDLTAYALNPAVGSYWKDPASPTTAQLTTGDGVIAYWGNPRSTGIPAAITTDLFISGSYDHRNARFYDGIKLKGGGDVDIHVANGTPLSEFALRGGGTNDLTWSWYNGLGVSLMEMVRGGSTNDDFTLSQKGTGNMTLRTGAASAIGIQINDSQNIVLGNTVTNFVTSKGYKLDMAQGIDGTNAYLQIAPLRSVVGEAHLNFISSIPADDYNTWGMRLVRYDGDDGVSRIQHRGTGDFEIWTGDAVAPFKALAISSAQTTTLEGDLYVDGGAASKKIIIGNGADSQPCGIEIGLARATAPDASFVDFTTELGAHDFDSRIHRSTVAAGGQLLLQNNGTGNTVLRVGDPAASVQTQRESFGGAGFRTGASGFTNTESNPKNLCAGAIGPAPDANVQCYATDIAMQNAQNTILARGTFHYDGTGSYPNRYSVGANSWNIDSVIETGATDGEVLVTMTLGALTPTPALPDVTYQVTLVHAGFGIGSTNVRVGMAKMGSSVAEIQVMLLGGGGSKMGATFFLTVIGPPTT